MACVTEPLDGVGPYSYIWVGFTDTDNCLESVGAGTYTCIVIDTGTGLSCGIDVMVTEPAPMALFSMQATPATCFEVCNGGANPIVIGGNGGFTFDYSSGEDTQIASMLCNPFTLTVTDSEGCSIDTLFTFENEPMPIVATAVIDSLDCFGDTDGSIAITPGGGTPPFQGSWTGPDGFTSTDLTIIDLEAGVYNLTIEDGNLCTAMFSYELLSKPAVVFSAMVTHVDCFGDGDGAIEITASGGSLIRPTKHQQSRRR